MLCDQCGERDSVVQLTKVGEDGVTEMRLCEVCAALKGIETSETTPQHPLAGVLQAAQESLARSTDAVRCSFCGTSQQDFRASGRLGCAHCYGAFAEGLRDLVRRVHGNVRHVGQTYAPPRPESIDRSGSLAVLRDRLRLAIEREEFEVAAALRDEIRGLE